MDRQKLALAAALVVLALALALYSLYRSFAPGSQWGSDVPPLSGGGPPSPTPAPLPPGLQGR